MDKSFATHYLKLASGQGHGQIEFQYPVLFGERDGISFDNLLSVRMSEYNKQGNK
jgi:hypothetical protein